LAGETGERFACAFYDALASALVDLGDTRVIATLEQAGAEPRGVTVGLREHQQATAARAIAALAERARLAVPPDNAAELAAWCPLPGETNATRDDHALWREAARSDAAHLVLADHLLDRGDRRGEIISLMCAGDAENRARGLELLHRYWPQWVGELALVLDRGNCTFTRGLLEVAAIGQRTTPEWAYRKVATHRELLPMRAVRPGWSASDSGYVAFLDALVELPQRVGLRASMVDTLARRRPSWPIRALDLVVDKPVDVALLARTLPDVDAVAIVAPSTLDETTVVLVDELLEAWPRVRVHVDASRWLWHRERTALLDLVRERLEIDHGMYG
ncbi:MAG TPA: hypothetical protein VK427_05265, partial [Kofleriaceae bacterium]|nr:hypothetical protein [Kofleriaceae bacterium]